VPDEETPHRPRRRPVLLAMLVAAALLLALAGFGAAGSGGSARSSDEGTGVTRDAPAAGQSPSQGGQGFTHRGRHCHHDQQQAPQQSPTEAPPV
jgi:hypothetical protein